MAVEDVAAGVVIEGVSNITEMSCKILRYCFGSV